LNCYAIKSSLLYIESLHCNSNNLLGFLIAGAPPPPILGSSSYNEGSSLATHGIPKILNYPPAFPCPKVPSI